MAKILVVANGRVIDPANGIDGVRHVIVRDGVIAAVLEAAPQFSAAEAPSVTTFDATGLVVCPGLVDMHAHLYTHATPLGVDVDHYCVGRGVTTCVDAGSAGATTLPGLREFIAKRSTTRVLAFVNIALHGLAAAGCTGSGTGGELDSLNQCSVEHCLAAVRANRDLVVGVKIRLSGDAADDGRNEPEAFRRALLVSEQAQVPLMTHHTFSEIPLGAREEGAAKGGGSGGGGGGGGGIGSGGGDADAGAGAASAAPASTTAAAASSGSATTDGAAVDSALRRLGCPGSLRRGDVYTHTFHGFASTIIDVGGGRLEVDPAVLRARERGVLFDVGHGQGSFNWTVAEVCAEKGFWPDIISTDLHTGGAEGPTYDLPTVMTRFLHLGMTLSQVVAASTSAPAAAIGWGDRAGSLGVGRAADIAVLQLEEYSGDGKGIANSSSGGKAGTKAVELEDCQGQLRRLTRRLRAVACWKDGRACRITAPKAFPNRASKSSADPSKLVVSDVVRRILARKQPAPSSATGGDQKRTCC